MNQLGLGVVAAISLTLPAFGQQAVNPPDGIYQLNFTKSTIRGPISKSQTLSVVGDTVTVVGIGADGKPYTFVDTNTPDGKPRPVTGSPAIDTSTWTQIDPYTTRMNRTKAGTPVHAGVRIFNPETKTVTLTVIAADGSYSHVLVYEKQ
jgi:hypothetical protein